MKVQPEWEDKLGEENGVCQMVNLHLLLRTKVKQSNQCRVQMSIQDYSTLDFYLSEFKSSVSAQVV